MIKVIRWQVPFVSLQGTHYRVDIYDEGYTGNPVVLTAGETPFTTDEDDSDDFFHPVRSQSGTLQVCTLKPDGNYITLDDLLPANNIARAVRLINLDNSNAIEWQGFLSCEAYSQDYTGIPQILDLPLISVLEAMASVEVDPAKLSGLNTVCVTIEKLLEIFSEKAGVSYFSEYYIPTAARGRNIGSKYIDATVLFEQKEYNNENSTTYIISGLSLKDCLERIAAYMGWCCREVGSSLYFFAADESSGYRRFNRHSIIDPSAGTIIIWTPDSNDTAVVTRDITALMWAGVDHRRTVKQGAKSVEVVAKLGKYNINIGFPEFPAGDVITSSKQIYILNTAVLRYLYAIVSKNDSAYSTVSLRYYEGTSVYNNADLMANNPSAECYEGVSTLEDALPTLFLSNPGRDLYTLPRYAGAFYIKIANEEEEKEDPSYNNGIYLSFIPGLRQDTNIAIELDPIFKYTTPLSYSLKEGGTFKFNVEGFALFGSFGQQGNVQYITNTPQILAHLRIGNYYWNGTGWVQTPTKFVLSLEEKDGHGEATISSVLGSRMEGQIEIAFYPHGVMNHTATPIGPHGDLAHRWYLYDEAAISKLDMSYEVNEDPNLTDRSENHYFRLLGTNFRDEISISTDIASNLNNQPSPSLIMNSATEAMTELNYGTIQAPDMRRPEVDLLNRLATYYGAARQRLDLIVEHPTAAPLPLLRLNGISPDSRKYLPLAESRDWRKDTCTLTCFETLETPSES